MLLPPRRCRAALARARRRARSIGVLARAADHTIALSDRLAPTWRCAARPARISGRRRRPRRGWPRTATRRRSRRERAPLVMYGGNLDPYQDLDCLLDGFARLRAVEPQARLVLVTHARGAPEHRRRAPQRWRGSRA